jgi:hypothetical protein
VTIHEAIEKSDGVVFRCTASGSDADRGLEVPAWMFERAACPDHAQLTAAPFINMTGLSALANLLRQVLKDGAASSNAPLSGAFESSHSDHLHFVLVIYQCLALSFPKPRKLFSKKSPPFVLAKHIHHLRRGGSRQPFAVGVPAIALDL